MASPIASLPAFPTRLGRFLRIKIFVLTCKGPVILLALISVSDCNVALQMTSDKPAKHNLQVQINNQTGISTLKKLAPKTVSHYNAASGASAATVRKGLIDGMKI